MRCPSCNTQNEPDSRFCGGCGARLSGAESRLAPTQKIETGGQPIQPMPPVGQRTSAQGPARLPSGPVAAPASFPLAPSVQRSPSSPRSAERLAERPASIPPSVAPSIPPTNGVGAGSMLPTSQRPRTDGEDSIAAVPPRRGLGVILVVLLLDLALAAAGGWMLREGLAGGTASTALPKPAASQPGSVPAHAKPGSAAATTTPGRAPGSNGTAGSASAPTARSASEPAAAAAPAPSKITVVPIVGEPKAIEPPQPPQPVAKPQLGSTPQPKRDSRRRKARGGLKPVDPYDDPAGPGPRDPFPPTITEPPPPPPPSPFP